MANEDHQERSELCEIFIDLGIVMAVFFCMTITAALVSLWLNDLL